LNRLAATARCRCHQTFGDSGFGEEVDDKHRGRLPDCGFSRSSLWSS
jgi:hypothetical protein